MAKAKGCERLLVLIRHQDGIARSGFCRRRIQNRIRNQIQNQGFMFRLEAQISGYGLYSCSTFPDVESQEDNSAGL
jgi:hypothetical protein